MFKEHSTEEIIKKIEEMENATIVKIKNKNHTLKDLEKLLINKFYAYLSNSNSSYTISNIDIELAKILFKN